ncbi:MAG: hypothetical protein ACK4ND_13900, partial [Cytophagaceae bacterium]
MPQIQVPTFPFFFSKEFSNRPSPLPPGTYPLATSNETEKDDGKFSVLFIDYSGETDYGHEVDGTLTILESSEHHMKAEFDFTTTNRNGDKEIQVGGS